MAFQSGVVVRLGIELLAISEMTEFLVSPDLVNKKKGRNSKSEVVHFVLGNRMFFVPQGVDSENGSWFLDSDLHSNSLRFPFYLRDIVKIPRNHLRLGKSLASER